MLPLFGPNPVASDSPPGADMRLRRPINRGGPASSLGHSRVTSRCGVAAWLVVLLMILSPCAEAQRGLRFESSVNKTEVDVGELIQFHLMLQQDSRQRTENPTAPNWGGLIVRQGPRLSNRRSNINGRVSIVVTWDWLLEAPDEGVYTIGPARLEVGGRLVPTDPIKITVKRRVSQALPAELRGEPISPARSVNGNSEIDRQLDGRLFLRPTVSNTSPYVGEPVIVHYTLYRDGPNLYNCGGQLPEEFTGVLHEELFNNSQFSDDPKTIGARQYRTSPLYGMALIPTKPGKISVQGFSLTGQLRVRNSRSRRDIFDQLMGGQGYEQVILPTYPIELDVKPLPAAGRPTDFSGTVGDFKLTHKAYPTTATTDDLITFTLTLSGAGAVELAHPPQLAEGDFEMVGMTPAVQKQRTSAAIMGQKSFEYVLRPKSSGLLRTPAVSHSIFDPYRHQYRALKIGPMQIDIKPGAPVPLNLSMDSVLDGLEADAEQGPRRLHFIKTLTTLQPNRPVPVLESPLFWLGQGVALMLLGLTWFIDRRRAALDPARVRRQGARRVFEKKVHALRQRLGQHGNPDEVAAGIEQAARGFIADHFNLSPDGLTRHEIEDLLRNKAMTTEKIQTLCDHLDQCAALRYSPATAAAGEGDLRQWVDEIEPLLKEGLRA